MPQFNPDYFSTQIVWLVITFGAMFFLMWKIALPRISDILEERDHKINDSLRKAELLKEDAETAMAAYEKTMADARAHAQETLRSVREQHASEAADRNAELSEKLSAQIADAEGRIADERAKALKEVRGIAADITQTAAERLTGTKVTKKAVTGAVDAVLKGAAS